MFEGCGVAALGAVDAWDLGVFEECEADEGVAAGWALDTGELFSDAAVEPAVADEERDDCWEPHEACEPDH